MVTVVIFVWVPFHVIVEDYVVLVVITIYVTIASTSSNVQEGLSLEYDKDTFKLVKAIN